MTPREAISSEWADLLTEGPLALGYDVATTEKGKSNPSGITVMQQVGRINMSRLVITWKTAEPEVARQVISAVMDDIEARKMKPRRLVIDASSEKYYAADMKTFIRKRCAVELISGNQKLKFRNEEMDSKTLLGNMYSAAMEDGFILLPSGAWIELDLRLVKRDSGRFVTDLGPGGEHGEVFDSGKLAYWGLQSRTNNTEGIKGVAVGGTQGKKPREGLKGSFKQPNTRRLSA